MTTKTMASLALALILTASIATGADARSRKHKVKSKSDDRVIALLQRVIADNAKLAREIADLNRRLRPDNVLVASANQSTPLPPRNPLAAIAPMPMPDVSPRTLAGYERSIARSSKLKDLTPKLADKVASILASCPGAKLTSGYRRGARVAGSGRPSLHSRYPSRAADLAGNPSCIRRQLAKWPGGLSVDYAAVRHYHVSYDPRGREWGARFAHRGSRYARVYRRYAAVR